MNWGGHTEWFRDVDGVNRVRWIPHRVVKGVAYDTPILGYRVSTCNTLRLWSAEAVESFDFEAFNVGSGQSDYPHAPGLPADDYAENVWPTDDSGLDETSTLDAHSDAPSDAPRDSHDADAATGATKSLRKVYQQADAFPRIFGDLGNRVGVPVALGLPVGHGPHYAPLPLGATYELSPTG